MAAFLHWIDRETYSMRTFTVEAQRLGVARRLPPDVLKDMDWGDEVYCIIRQRKKDAAGVVFGHFRVTRLTGLNQEATKGLLERDLVGTCVEIGGLRESRILATYITGPSFLTTATIAEICEWIDDEAQWPMITGPFTELDRPAMLMDVPFALGARIFDADAFLRGYAIAIVKESKRPFIHLKGMYYPQGERIRKEGGEGEVGSVLRYKDIR